MRKCKILLFVALCLVTLQSYSQTNPRLVNAQYMQTVFYDDFIGSTIDRNTWDVSSHYIRELGFLVDNPLNINVYNGNLELKMKYVPNYLDSIWKTTGWKHVYSDYTGAEISTKQLFRYGSFECSAKFAHEKGSWPAFWIIGWDGISCPPGGYGNEIDIAEFKCDDSSNTLDHVIHRYYPPANCDDSNIDTKDFYAYSGISFDDNFHLFKCVWSPENIKYYVDGVFTHQVSNTGQEWYPNLQLSVILSQQVVDPIGAVIAPQTTYFNYVRVKQFFLAPEITISTEVICTSGTATMDVAAEATNVTWQLSPSNMFSATSGNGKVATITRTSGANGKGKITYTFQMPSGETFTAEKEILVGTQVPGTIFIQMDAPPRRFTATIDNVPTATSYNWYLDGVLNTTYHGTSAIFNRKSPYCGKWYGVSVEAINNCGTSARTSGLAVEPGCFFLLLLSPNPTGSETTVELVSEKGEEIEPDVSWDLEVYDPGQQLKVKQAGVKGKSAKLNTSGWKDGVYIVRATYNGNVFTDRLIVRR